VGSIPANPDAQYVPASRLWQFEMKLGPFFKEGRDSASGIDVKHSSWGNYRCCYLISRAKDHERSSNAGELVHAESDHSSTMRIFTHRKRTHSNGTHQLSWNRSLACTSCRSWPLPREAKAGPEPASCASKNSCTTAPHQLRLCDEEHTWMDHVNGFILRRA
jgi:hypothetical protein